jgi:hypothetical protein
MKLAPQPGFQYRRPDTKQLVDQDGFDADPTDLDTARALACGDLVEVAPSRPKKAASAAAS